MATKNKKMNMNGPVGKFTIKSFLLSCFEPETFALLSVINNNARATLFC